MNKLILLTDEDSEFLIAKSDLMHFTSMNVDRIKSFFLSQNYSVDIYKFSALDLNRNFKGVFILYQTSEAPGSFYKRYIEDLVYFLEKQGAIVLPNHELLKAHHNKIFMELLRMKFTDNCLKTISSHCYGSWIDAMNYDSEFPVVIKQSSSSGGAGVFLAKNKDEYNKYIKKAGQILISSSYSDFFSSISKKVVKKTIKYFTPEKSRYLSYNTTPVSTSLVIQSFIKGLSGDFKVLIFGKKYYSMYRKNREHDFRASGSGQFFPVQDDMHEGLLTFARRIKAEIDFPIFGLDVGFDGKNYHLFEFQVIHLGTSALHRSKFWHEYRDGNWIKFEGQSNLEEEFSRSVNDYINSNFSSLQQQNKEISDTR